MFNKIKEWFLWMIGERKEWEPDIVHSDWVAFYEGVEKLRDEISIYTWMEVVEQASPADIDSYKGNIDEMLNDAGAAMEGTAKVMRENRIKRWVRGDKMGKGD